MVAPVERMVDVRKDLRAPSLVRVRQRASLGEVLKAQVVYLALAGQHDTGDLAKGAAATDHGKDHSGQMLIGGELFGVTVAFVLLGCPVNVPGIDEI